MLKLSKTEVMDRVCLVYFLHNFKLKSLREIAEFMDVSIDTVKRIKKRIEYKLLSEKVTELISKSDKINVEVLCKPTNEFTKNS